MVNGLYTARNSMMLLQDKLDNASHNLANAQTTGFKKSMMVSLSRVDIQRNDEYLLHQDENQRLVENRLVWEQGPLVQTEDPFDLALAGDGVFTVQDEEGNVRYTRNGAFTLNGSGELCTLNGMRVLDDAQNLIVIDGEDFTVNEKGTIFTDGQYVAQLGIVEFSNPALQLQRVSKNLLMPVTPDIYPNVAVNTGIKQGMLEGSNVNTIDGMVELIKINRHNELNSKMLTSVDETLSKAVNEIGRVS
jgi:flagellar basal-body rod protein FlgF